MSICYGRLSPDCEVDFETHIFLVPVAAQGACSAWGMIGDILGPTNQCYSTRIIENINLNNQHVSKIHFKLTDSTYHTFLNV